MFKLDNNFLTTLGLGSLPVEEKNKLLQHIYERLEMNVGMRLAEKMSDTQLDEFESFIDRNDEAGALRWLETNFPNYKEVVAEELEKLKKEVSQAAPHILEAAQAATPDQAPQSVDQQPYGPPVQPQFQGQPQMPQAPAPQFQQPAQPQQPGNPYGQQPLPAQPNFQQNFQPNPSFPPAQQPYPSQDMNSPQQGFPPAQPQPPMPPQPPPVGY